MSLKHAMHQTLGQPGRANVGEGEPQLDVASDEASLASHTQEGSGQEDLLQQILLRKNMVKAWKHVKANKGSAGIDGLTIEQTTEYLKTHWSNIREELLSGQYQPQAVRRVEIPKPGSGTRELGISTVVDRLIQQAMLQVLQPLIDPTFSNFSYGFRPARIAHNAVLQAKRYVEEGYQIVVDIDLEKFFDRINHDILIDRLSKKIHDKAVLGLIRRYLQAGTMADGVVMERVEGTPQGGPLSPLLANVLLDEVDKALEQRGHQFARYADDCNVYVHSQRAGERVLQSLRCIYAKLHLKVNEAKTTVGTVFGRKFLGYCLRRWSGNTVKTAVATKALETFKQRIRLITCRVGGRSMIQVAERLRAYLPGWKSYFRLAQTPTTFKDLDSWLRHRLRAMQLKHWRRGSTIYRELRKLGATHEMASLMAGGAGHWWRHSKINLNMVLTVTYFNNLGVPWLT
jgi:RNA-directed DNA polymerase